MVTRSFVANLQAAIVSEPGESAFNHIAELSEAAAVILVIDLGDQRMNVAVADTREDVRRSVRTITLEDLRPEAWATQRTLDRGDRVQEVQSRNRVADVCGCDADYQWDSVCIGHGMAFATSLGALGWVWPGVDPPKTARIEALSTTARDQSISPRRPRALRSRWCSSPQMPNAVQRSSRLQHVQPLPQPNSAVRSFQGIPDLSTNRMPARHLRSGTRGRPPLGRGTSMGRSGAISFQSASVTRMDDMSNPLSLVTHRRFLSMA